MSVFTGANLQKVLLCVQKRQSFCREAVHARVSFASKFGTRLLRTGSYYLRLRLHNFLRDLLKGQDRCNDSGGKKN